MKKFVQKGNQMGQKGQLALGAVLGLVILLFIVFTVGRILFNNTALDPDISDGGATVADPLTRIALYTMTAIVLLAAMASIAVKFF